MEREKTNPASRVYSIYVRMMTLLSDPSRDIVDRNDPVEDHNDHEDEQTKCEVVQEWIAYHYRTPLSTKFGS
jgi:hypothetical protein